MAVERYLPARHPGDAHDCAPIVRRALLADPQREYAIGADGRSIRFGELAIRVARLQAVLGRWGLAPGDRVAVMLPNGVDHIALIFALMLSRLVWLPVNTRLKEAGVRHLVEHGQPRLLIAGADFDEAVAPLRGQVDIVHFDDFVPAKAGPEAGEPAAGPTLVDGDPADVLALIYTSGTSGPPKGVLFSHRMLRVAAEATLIVADVRPGDRMLFWEPLCHIGGAQLLLLPFLIDVRYKLLDRFSAGSFWTEAGAFGATHVHYLGGILDMLALHPVDPRAKASLRVFWGAGATPTAWQRIHETFGLALRECYGMTEGSSFATVNDDGTPMSIGRPLPWVSIELQRGAEDVDKANAGEADAGKPDAGEAEAGEIVMTSAIEGAITAGYLNDPETTARTIRDGRLHTGDMARRDAEGRLQFIGRRSDSMRVRGENVSAWEVERAFASHPDVALVAAVGVASALGENDILLYVKTRDDRPADFAGLRDWGRRLLAPYQQPRYFRQIDAFVLTPSERIRKQFLSRDVTGSWDASQEARA